jgi:hypothetical protein
MPLLEFAGVLGISTTHAYDLARKNELPVPVFKAGQKWIVSRRAVDALLDARHPVTATVADPDVA